MEVAFHSSLASSPSIFVLDLEKASAAALTLQYKQDGAYFPSLRVASEAHSGYCSELFFHMQ